MEKNLTNITVIIPAFNCAASIRDTLLSIKNQTLPEYMYDIVVIDNCSNDFTAEVAGGFGVKVYRNRKPLTRIENWNECLQYLCWKEVDYAKFVFAGDTLMPDCLEKQFMTLRKYRSSFVTSAHEVINQDGSSYIMKHYDEEKKFGYGKELYQAQLAKGNFLAGCMAAPLFSPSKYHFFNHHLEWAADWDFWTNITTGNHKNVVYLPEPLVRMDLRHRKHYQKLAGSKEAAKEEALVVAKLNNLLK